MFRKQSILKVNDRFSDCVIGTNQIVVLDADSQVLVHGQGGLGLEAPGNVRFVVEGIS